MLNENHAFYSRNRNENIIYLFSDLLYNQMGEYDETAFPLTVSSKSQKIVTSHVFCAAAILLISDCVWNPPNDVIERVKKKTPLEFDSHLKKKMFEGLSPVARLMSYKITFTTQLHNCMHPKCFHLIFQTEHGFGCAHSTLLCRKCQKQLKLH